MFDKSSKNQGEKEQTFNILPHPAKSNDPADLNPPHQGGGLRSNPIQGALHARDPYVPPPHIRNNMPEPKGRDELRARQAELNRK
ncbi:hypothetical protein BD626DRAFT_457258 [Schizophyllum amplum]|uniref:Uncharacterized protein n=1 Tax=Schizophyllum amplum TaxID=97359 RepID=A0A550CE46_9AGAR|nr:hypothetical protein BD626DRAFT_457258 [Auriculariopsis ampla]